MITHIRYLLCVVALGIPLFAGEVITGTLESGILGTGIGYVVVIPDTYAQSVERGKRFPVLYLLHCAGCDARLWQSASYGPEVQRLVDSVGFIMVAPDDASGMGTRSYSWWLDSPLREEYRTSSFLVQELKPFIDAHYATLPNRENTGLAGHSMGGFGAFYNLIRHPDIFSVAFSIKGAFDISYPHNSFWPSYFGMDFLLGTGAEHEKNYRQASILENACAFAGSDVRIGFYGGKQDAWFFDENRRLDAVLTDCGVVHWYYEAEESHFSVPFEQMKKIVTFFDTSFTYSPETQNRVLPRDMHRGDGGSPAGNPVYAYTLRGRRIALNEPGGAALGGLSYVCVVHGGTVVRLFDP